MFYREPWFSDFKKFGNAVNELGRVVQNELWSDWLRIKKLYLQITQRIAKRLRDTR